MAIIRRSLTDGVAQDVDSGAVSSAVRTVRSVLTELSASGRLPIIQEKKRWRIPSP